MTTPTLSTYTDRLRAIMAAKSGIGTDVSAGADMATLPAYEVYTRDGNSSKSGRHWQGDLTLVVRVYISLIGDASKEAPVRTALTAARAVVLDYVDWLWQHDALRLNDAGVAVYNGDISFSIGIMPYNSNAHGGFDLEIPITYNRG